MNRTHILPLALLSMLDLARCGQDPVVLVSVSGIPDEARLLRVTPTLNDARAMLDRDFDAHGPATQGATTPIALVLPSRSSGKLGLDVAALQAEGCTVAAGHAETMVDGEPLSNLDLGLSALDGHELSVDKQGNGGGTVASEPREIDCGPKCDARFAACARVTLEATPDQNSDFLGWSGACTGTGPCVLVLADAAHVSALFARESHLLTVTRSGEGTVTSDPAGIDCGTSTTRCQAGFPAGAQVTLLAASGSDSYFAGWEGACKGTDPCRLLLGGPTQVTAKFAPKLALSVEKPGRGHGTVTSDPAGIRCGDTCSFDFAKGTQVTLTAVPDADSDFSGWDGPCLSTGTCTVVVGARTTVKALFALKRYALTLSKLGNGSGTVKSDSGGIDCGPTCSANYDAGARVTLTATPATGSTFSGWSGGGCSGTRSTCTVTLNAAAAVTASFQLQQVSLTVTVASPGFVTGAVTTGDAKISCGKACSATYDYGTKVTLTAAPAGGFLKWEGDCSGTTSGCTLTLSAARSVTATFSAGFSAATGYAVGRNPGSLAVGDFNLDGKPDCVTANADSNNVSVLLGKGMGGFGPAATLAVGRRPDSVAVGDFNLDGKPDLAVADADDNNVSVLLGDGTGGFGPAATFAVGNLPSSVAVGDFNLDGKPDLAIADYIANTVSVLLGNGMGSFGAASNFAVGIEPTSLLVRDFNGDGKFDLAVANCVSDNVSVLLGDGTGGFGPAAAFAAGSCPWGLAAGDFNGDGKADLAVANIKDGKVSVLPGNGMGAFGPASTFDAGGAIRVTVGDFNGDGKADLAVPSGGNNMGVLLGNGTGGFGPAYTFDVGGGSTAAVAGDFNGDGKADLAVTAVTIGGSQVSVLLNQSH